MNVGEIYLIEFPSRGGHAQAGKRPAIILQKQEISDKIPTILAIPLTSQQKVTRFPATIEIEPNPDNGLNSISVALVFQLASIDKRYITTKIGQVSDEVLQKIFEKLNELTGQK